MSVSKSAFPTRSGRQNWRRPAAKYDTHQSRWPRDLFMEAREPHSSRLKDAQKASTQTPRANQGARARRGVHHVQELGRRCAVVRETRGRSPPNLRLRSAQKSSSSSLGRATDIDKIQALYDYVAKNVRYVSLSFGLGRYQPHDAGEIFTNEYGDCKDKATLLSSMMRAAGISSDVALIAFWHAKLDECQCRRLHRSSIRTSSPSSRTKQRNALDGLHRYEVCAISFAVCAAARQSRAARCRPDGKGKIGAYANRPALRVHRGRRRRRRR